MAGDRRSSRLKGTRLGSGMNFASDPGAQAAGALPPGARGELLSLMERLRDELNAFLDDVAVGRESSRNRD
jgi:hypothetical protein